MKAKNITFRMAARCEAAGRPNNEDNYQVDSNLSDNKWSFTADEVVELGDKGALFVVCDGMGGMNAGEVASSIAVNTIKKYFMLEKLTAAALANPCKYIEEVIVEADAAIKAHSKEHPETQGMGSTVVMAWLMENKVYVGWCGDSRCYRFSPANGLERLSHDHSYVQELVDAGKLTEELAFDHPNSNIITRSLGDPRGAAKPDSKVFEMFDQDIILLCSDGLCGTLRDNEIENIIRLHQTSMQECRNALWEADEAAGWTDNTTIVLAQILSGCGAPSPLQDTSEPQMSASKIALLKSNKRLKWILGIVLMLICVAAIAFSLHKIIPVIQNKIVFAADSTLIEGNTSLPLPLPTATEEKPGANSTLSTPVIPPKKITAKPEGKSNVKEIALPEEKIVEVVEEKPIEIVEEKPVEVIKEKPIEIVDEKTVEIVDEKTISEKDTATLSEEKTVDPSQIQLATPATTVVTE